jgi:hypothetical protein
LKIVTSRVKEDIAAGTAPAMARPIFCRCHRMVHGEPQSSPLDKNSVLIALGEEILSALGAVEVAARSALSSEAPALAMPALAYQQNQMAGENRTARFVSTRKTVPAKQ